MRDVQLILAFSYDNSLPGQTIIRIVRCRLNDPELDLAMALAAENVDCIRIRAANRIICDRTQSTEAKLAKLIGLNIEDERLMAWWIKTRK